MKHLVLLFLMSCCPLIAFSEMTMKPSPSLDHLMFFKNGTLIGEASFEKVPIEMEESLIRLVFKDSTSQLPVEISDRVKVSLWMPEMNHGSAPTQIERILDESGNILPGHFLVRGAYFTMGGKWQVWFDLKDSDGKIERKSFEVFIQIENHGHQQHSIYLSFL